MAGNDDDIVRWVEELRLGPGGMCNVVYVVVAEC
jgi:hypothetical protein